MSREDEQDKLDFDVQDDFDFSFDLGITPQFELGLSQKNKVPFYEIAIDEKMRNDYIANYTRRYGEFQKAEVSEDKDILKGKIEALDNNGSLLEEGPANDFATLAIDIIKDEDIKKSFIGLKDNDHVDFDIKKAFPNDNEVAGLLKKKKEEVEAIEGTFRFTVSEITRFHPAEQGKELYDKIYGEGVVNSEEEFNKKIEDEITASLKTEGDFKLMQDIRKLTLEKTEFQLPEDFLKRWLLKVNENTNAEQIDKEFDSFRNDLKWQLIRNKVAKENDVKITEEELLKEAEIITRNQFRQYGLFYATDEQVSNYAKETLKREDDAKRIADKILDEKVLGLLKDKVKVENKSVTVDEFNKLFE
jgi:trigger factor